MASYSATKAVSATLVANTVDQVTLNTPFNVVTVYNTGSSGTITLTVDGSTPTAGGDGTTVAPGQSVIVRNAVRVQGESSAVNGVGPVPGRRRDVAAVTRGNSVVQDTSIVSTDVGRQVLGEAVPYPSYVGTVTPGVSFILSSSQTTTVPQNAIANEAFVSLAQLMTYTISGAVFARGVDPGNVLSNSAIGTFPSFPFVSLVSAGTPSYTVIGG